MGTSTNFKGELKFTRELTSSELSYLNQFLGGDIREHPEWFTAAESAFTRKDQLKFNRIDLELTEAFDGLQWDGSEKTYEMVDAVNFLLERVRGHLDRDFGLEGSFYCQGDEIGDVWQLIINDKGLAEHVDLLAGKKSITCPACKQETKAVLCPNCEEQIIVEDVT